LALDAKLVLYRNRKWTEKREFRLKQRNLDVILFFEGRCVKDIPKILLCKRNDRSVGGNESSEIIPLEVLAPEVFLARCQCPERNKCGRTHGASCGDREFPDIASDFLDAQVDVAFFGAGVDVHIELVRVFGGVELECAFLPCAHAEAGEAVHHAGVGEHGGRPFLTF
jgi:hypothetical protein